jgi:hypothetical protein
MTVIVITLGFYIFMICLTHGSVIVEAAAVFRLNNIKRNVSSHKRRSIPTSSTTHVQHLRLPIPAKSTRYRSTSGQLLSFINLEA